MSRISDSPVQTQMAVSVFKSLFGREYHGGNGLSEGKPSGRRRVFVQTETGCVLGMELDRSDNVHTVKRRLQLALNVPTDSSSLTFGDTVLKNDLSAIRNDSPLLLMRNIMHRSSSTPCLSPTSKDIQSRDQGGPIEILGHSGRLSTTKQIVKEIVKGLKSGIEPIPAHGGLGGAYYFRNSKGESVAIVKPSDEEPFAPNNPKGFVGKALGQPGLKRTVRVGETGYREVAAYILDYDHFANVPATALVKITHSIFNVNNGMSGNKSQTKELVCKIASFQEFVHHDFDASDYGTSSYPVSSVHRIGILDVRILNTDRHGGNLLVKKLDGVGLFGQVELIPIDHGLCLPETLEDPYFEWMHWPQASIPFSDEELEYIEKLDPIRDCSVLRNELPMIREACLRVLIVCTVFLKEAAAYGLCLAEIGEMMSREFRCGNEEPSELEVLCIEARRLIIVDKEMHSPKSIGSDLEFQFDIDCEDSGFGLEDFVTGKGFHFGRTPLSKLDESNEDEEEEKSESEDSDNVLGLSTKLGGSNLSFSTRNTTNLVEKNRKVSTFTGSKTVYNQLGSSSSSGHRSANEQLPPSECFVKLADMNVEEWPVFLEKFKELLGSAFSDRKSSMLGQRQRQRLGTSCQF